MYSFTGELAGPKFDKESIRQNMCKLVGVLSQHIELNGGFLDSLVSKETLSREHAIEIARSSYSKTGKLLDFLLFRYSGDYCEVIEALMETGQQHVVNFILLAGGTFRI